jgi:hypothetical protein
MLEEKMTPESSGRKKGAKLVPVVVSWIAGVARDTFFVIKKKPLEGFYLDQNLHVGRPDQTVFKKGKVVEQIRTLGPSKRQPKGFHYSLPVGSPDHHFVVEGEISSTIITRGVSHSSHVTAVEVHCVQLQVTISGRSEDDALSVRADGRLGVVASSVADTLKALVFQISEENGHVLFLMRNRDTDKVTL